MRTNLQIMHLWSLYVSRSVQSLVNIKWCHHEQPTTCLCYFLWYVDCRSLSVAWESLLNISRRLCESQISVPISIVLLLQSSAVITWSNIAWYCTHHCRSWGKISIGGWTHQRHPIPRPDGRAMGCLSEYFGENWYCYNGTALYYVSVWYWTSLVGYFRLVSVCTLLLLSYLVKNYITPQR